MRLVGGRKEFLECRDEVMLGFDFNKYITDQTTQVKEKAKFCIQDSYFKLIFLKEFRKGTLSSSIRRCKASNG